MLISYPVLPTSAVNDDEDVYFRNILANHALDDEGKYPISDVLAPTGPMYRWHGGIHMQGAGEPVRAIADGTVVAYRFAPACENYEGKGAYDTSFVLIRHETETGENTKVAYYSLYMHLANRGSLLADRYAQLPPWMKQAAPSAAVRKPNQKIWRKDILGFGGQLYDRETWHFEVFCTDSDIDAFWRDSLFKSEGTGSDDYFGDAHFVLPAGRTFHARHPGASQQGPHKIVFAGQQHYDLPIGAEGNSPNELYVSVRLDKGTRTATTYERDAQGNYVPLGQPVEQRDYEYELLRLATALYPDCPSAGYEWLRFGRLLGPDTTTRNENWQLVRYAVDKVGYVDLAPSEIVKLSDADFPFWHGWEKRSQGAVASASDGLCSDRELIELLRMGGEVAKRRLRHLVCKHPSEWDASDVDTRYASLRAPGQPLHETEHWARFIEHCQKLAFWAEAGIPERSVWHFHPLHFVRHYRNATWLSTDELAQCLPRKSLSDSSLEWSEARGRAIKQGGAFNRLVRKYCGAKKIRVVHILAQIYIETGILRTIKEDGSGASRPYGPFYGRGLLQITWAGNYRDYGRYKNIAAQAHPHYSDSRITATSSHPVAQGGASMQWAPRYDPELLATEVEHLHEASGWFWVSKHFRGTSNINRAADAGLSASVVAFVCWLINGGPNGYRERQQFAKYLGNVLLDNATLYGESQFQYPAFGPQLTHFPPSEVAGTLNCPVSYDRQTSS